MSAPGINDYSAKLEKRDKKKELEGIDQSCAVTPRSNHVYYIPKITENLEIQVIYVQLDQYGNCKNIQHYKNNNWNCHVCQHTHPCIFDLFIPGSEIFLILTFCRLKLHLFSSISRYVFDNLAFLIILLSCVFDNLAVQEFLSFSSFFLLFTINNA